MNDGVALTAVGAAAARAVESSRETALINDPYATALVAAAGASVPFPVCWPAENAELTEQQTLLLMGANYVGIRSRYFDDFLLKAVDDGVRQVVILASGLDTRAFRLDLPADLRIFEIDQPQVLDFKAQALHSQDAHSNCTVVSVGVDLREDWPTALQTAGFDANLPSAWLVEGLLVYLSATEELGLLNRVNDLSTAGSLIALEGAASLPEPSAEDLERLREASEQSGLPMSEILKIMGSRPDLTSTLNSLSWSEQAELADAVASRYGRSLIDPRFAPTNRASAAPSATLLSGQKS